MRVFLEMGVIVIDGGGCGRRRVLHFENNLIVGVHIYIVVVIVMRLEVSGTGVVGLE